MENQYNPAVYRQNAASAEALLLREISKRQMRGYKFRRQAGCTPMSVEFVCVELKLVILLYSDHFTDRHNTVEDSQFSGQGEHKGYHVARIGHSEVLTDLIGVIESLGAVVRQCKQAIELSRLACRYLSGNYHSDLGR